MLASGSVQEAQDLALVAHSVTLQCRVPFIHFFDGFRTSHEVNKITALHKDEIRAFYRQRLACAHRARALNPDHPVMRGNRPEPGYLFPVPRERQPLLRSSTGAGAAVHGEPSAS